MARQTMDGQGGLLGFTSKEPRERGREEEERHNNGGEKRTDLKVC